MTTLFEQVIGDTSDLRTIKVKAHSVVDVSDDENGNSVFSEQWQASITHSVQVESNGKTCTQIKSRIELEVHDIDAMIAALQVAKKEIYIKRMEAATVSFNADRERDMAEEAAKALQAHEEAAAEIQQEQFRQAVNANAFSG